MIPADQALIIIVILLLFGFANVFFGKEIFRPLLFVYGFLVGAVFVGAATQAMNAESNLLVTLVIGVIAGFMAYAIFYVGVFMLGGITGFLVLSMLAGIFGIELGSLAIVLTVGICGGLALIFHDYVLMFATAAAGADMIALAIYLMFPDTRARFSPITIIEFVEVSQGARVIGALILVVLTILGTFVQWKAHTEHQHQDY